VWVEIPLAKFTVAQGRGTERDHRNSGRTFIPECPIGKDL
jgi:hypothetical protein